MLDKSSIYLPCRTAKKVGLFFKLPLPRQVSFCLKFFFHILCHSSCMFAAIFVSLETTCNAIVVINLDFECDWTCQERPKGSSHSWRSQRAKKQLQLLSIDAAVVVPSFAARWCCAGVSSSLLGPKHLDDVAVNSTNAVRRVIPLVPSAVFVDMTKSKEYQTNYYQRL
jgi:hypothetical protein